MPVMLVSNISRHSSTDSSATGLNTPTPALLITMSMPPSAAAVLAIADSICVEVAHVGHDRFDTPRAAVRGQRLHGGAQVGGVGADDRNRRALPSQQTRRPPVRCRASRR